MLAKTARLIDCAGTKVESSDPINPYGKVYFAY